jgi:hypothetical protein
MPSRMGLSWVRNVGLWLIAIQRARARSLAKVGLIARPALTAERASSSRPRCARAVANAGNFRLESILAVAGSVTKEFEASGSSKCLYWVDVTMRPIDTLLYSACRSQLLANRVRPCVRKPNAAEHIYYRRRRNRNIVLYSACRFQLLANRVRPCAHMHSAAPDNLGHSSSLEVPTEIDPLLQEQSTLSVS